MANGNEKTTVEIISFDPPLEDEFKPLKDKALAVGAKVKALEEKKKEIVLGIVSDKLQKRAAFDKIGTGKGFTEADRDSVQGLSSDSKSKKEQVKEIDKEIASLVKDGLAALESSFSVYLQKVREALGTKSTDVVEETKRQLAIHLAEDSYFDLYSDITAGKLPWHARAKRSCKSYVYRAKTRGLRKNYVKEVADPRPIMEEENKAALLFPVYEPVKALQQKANALRVDGEDKEEALIDEIKKIKHDKEIDKDTKAKILASDKKQLSVARAIAHLNAKKIKTLVNEGQIFIGENYGTFYLDQIKVDGKKRKEVAVKDYASKLSQAKADNQRNIAEVNALPGENPAQKREKALRSKNVKLTCRNHLNDLKMNHQKVLQNIKDDTHSAFIYKYHLIDILRNSRFTPYQNAAQKAEASVYNFSPSGFFLKYGLYIAIIFIFAIFCIVAPVQGRGNLLTIDNIFNIFDQSAPRMFLALAVAGTIVLAGTDLSVGRMVALSTITTSMIFHDGNNAIKLFGNTLNFDSWPIAGRIIAAIAFSVLFCTFFSAVAGFFSAKFKMHPFISTLGTELIIYGLVYYATDGAPSGGINSTIQNDLAPWLGSFPTTILWAIGIIVVMWFVWNKTKFGKYMFAVGGNPEAASMSGISVFWVTLGVFIMAGILYGMGGFLEAVRVGGSASAGYGSGWEMDAIAAAVVGGVSFFGGIGKVSGVVIGVLIFQALTYALSFMGINTNLQFVLKGVIIITAVTLDSFKYIRRK